MFEMRAEARWGSMASRSWDTDMWCANIGRAQTQLGWSPRYSLAEGLARMKSWLEERAEIRSRYAYSPGRP
jgi:nucleoside-diphosphate-sugar epimerase